MGRPRSPLPPVAVLAERYRSGATLLDLGIEYHTAPDRIRTLLARAGVAIRKRGWSGDAFRHTTDRLRWDRRAKRSRLALEAGCD